MNEMAKIFMYLCFLVIGIILYSRFVGTTGLTIKEYNIVNENIPESFYGTTILQISDLHYGRVTKGKELEAIVDEINLIKPDLVVFTGDLIDKDVTLSNSSINILIEEFSRIESELGKYTILGNHDYFQDETESIIRESGFQLLKNEYDVIYNGSNEPIFLAGVDDLMLGEPNMEPIMEYFNVEEASEATPLPIYKILLMHEPDYYDEVEQYSFDLILAGHSHNGQVRLPVIGKIWTPEGSKKYYEAYYKKGDTEFYISGGIGTSTLNFRLLCRPSMNLYRLKNK